MSWGKDTWKNFFQTDWFTPPFLVTCQSLSWSKTANLLRYVKYQRNLRLDPILSEINPKHSRATIVKPFNYQTISHTYFYQVVTYSGFRLTLPVHFLYLHACYRSCPTHPPSCNFIAIFEVKKQLWSSSVCNGLHSPVTAFLLSPNTLLSTFSQTHSLYALPLRRGTKFHSNVKRLSRSACPDLKVLTAANTRWRKRRQDSSRVQTN